MTLQIVLWVDGCFDLCHYGHLNALRQTKKLFANCKLLVGVHTDEEIQVHKGPTIMSSKDRYEMVRSCRWVDGVIEGAPYVTKLKILNDYGVKFCVHGEDISYDADGNNTYQELIDAGKYLTIKRTRGVSTTNVVRRLLNISKNPKKSKKDYDKSLVRTELDEERMFFPSALQISQFSTELKPPKKDDKIVYVDGTFDLFHVGHVEFLKKARKEGDYLIVGIHDDETIKVYKGKKFPILTLHERLLGLLSCKYVDDVIVGAPFSITKQMIESYNISRVIVGSTYDAPLVKKMKDFDPYLVPRTMKIMRKIKSPRLDLTIDTIIERIEKNVSVFLEKVKKKKSEKEIFVEIKKEKEKK